MASIYKIEHNGDATDTSFVEHIYYPGGPGEVERHTRRLAATFKVYNQGLNHIAGLTFSIDGWRTRSEAVAVFSRSVSEFGAMVEVWTATLHFECSLDSHTHRWVGVERAEYVLWCEDYRMIDNVKKIYRTSHIRGGEPFISIYGGATQVGG